MFPCAVTSIQPYNYLTSVPSQISSVADFMNKVCVANGPKISTLSLNCLSFCTLAIGQIYTSCSVL